MLTPFVFLNMNVHCVIKGLAPPEDGPQFVDALVPDLLVAGVIVLVPALTPLDKLSRKDKK